MAFYKIKSGRVTGERGVLQYVGEIGHLFYSQDDNVIRISDGHTLGGIPLSGGSITFISIGAPPNPLEGQLWWNTVDGRLYIWYDNNWVDASPESNVAEDNDTGYTTTATVTQLIANSLTNYATQVYVNSRGFITTAALAGYATETWVTNHNYLQVETGVHSVTGTANQVIVTDLGNRDIQLSTPQNLNSTATVTFGNLTVNNLNVLNTLTSVVPAVVDGYRIYLASNSTQDTQIDGGGIVLGTSTWTTGILYSLNNNYWYTMDDAGFQTEHLTATKTTVTTLTVTGGANIGYSNLQGEFANALLQIDAAADTYSQVNFQNHSSSTWASGDFVVTNDIGTDGKHFIDMGINSSRWSTSSWVINGANDGYLYIDSGNLAIGTTATEIVTFIGPTDTADSIISRATATTITYSVDLMPSQDATYQLGKPGLRWKGIYVGTGSLWIQDISLGTDAELTVDAGVLYVNGAYQLQVGQLKFFENTIESTTGATDIQIGLTTSTANLVLNRNTVIATGKSLVFGSGGLQTVAWNSTATVLYNQITGVPGFATTATVTALIANSLTNYATQTYVTTRGYITSSSLSVTTGSAVSGGALAYSTTTGVFTFNPATAYTLSTATASTLGGVKIGTGINAAVDGTISVTPFSTGTLVAHAVLADTATTATNAGYAYSFNTGTLVTTAVTANTVAGGYVSSITAGTGTQVSTSTGAVTVWALPAQAITSTGTTQTTGLTVDFSGPSFITWQPSGNGTRTITLTGFTPGRKVEMFITPHGANDVFTVNGVTTTQCSNGKNTFTMNGVGASEQTSFILQFYCTTNAIGGVWIYGNGSL